MFTNRSIDNPELLVGACLVWIPIVVWIVSLVHWMIQGDVDAAFGFTGIGVALGAGYLALNPPKNNPYLLPALLTAVILTVALFVPIRNALSQHALISIDIEAIERAYEQLDEKPGNVGMRFKLAKLLYRRGLHGHALAIAEDALKSMPEDAFTEEHKQVASWRRQEHDPGTFRAMACVECGFSNPPGELYCRRCNAKFLLDQAKGRWIGRTTAKKLIAGWIALMGVCVGIPVAVTSLPLVAAALALTGISIMVLTTLYAAFLGGKAKPAH